MARARNIKPAFFANDDLADVDPLGRLLFIGLWTVADREGRLEDRPRRIKAEVLPYDDCDIDGLLNDLQAHGFITRYVVDGTSYIQVLNFTKHQNPHVREAGSTIPAPCLHSANTNIGNQGSSSGVYQDVREESPQQSNGGGRDACQDQINALPQDGFGESACKSTGCSKASKRESQGSAEHRTSTVQAGLIPDSGFPLTDSGFQREAAPESPPASQSSRSTRATRLPENWKLPKAWRDWALSERPDWSDGHVETVADSFHDYWIAKGGADARKVSWEATWRNWVRREKEMAPRSNVANQNRQEALEARNREAAARFARMA